jgi:hypothetical protein
MRTTASLRLYVIKRRSGAWAPVTKFASRFNASIRCTFDFSNDPEINHRVHKRDTHPMTDAT